MQSISVMVFIPGLRQFFARDSAAIRNVLRPTLNRLQTATPATSRGFHHRTATVVYRVQSFNGGVEWGKD
jgi:hypothetical protein